MNLEGKQPRDEAKELEAARKAGYATLADARWAALTERVKNFEGPGQRITAHWSQGYGAGHP